MMNSVVTEKTETKGHHTFTEVEVKLPANETDVVLVYPNGQKVAIQHRLEGPTLDICFEEDSGPLDCTNWVGVDMTPAKGVRGAPHVRRVDQLMICIPPAWVDPPF